MFQAVMVIALFTLIGRIVKTVNNAANAFLRDLRVESSISVSVGRDILFCKQMVMTFTTAILIAALKVCVSYTC